MSEYPQFPHHCRSLLKKHLTLELYNELLGTQAPMGFGLDDLIRSGVEQPDSAIGVYAGSVASYKAFAPLFDPIIADYHGVNQAAIAHPRGDLSLAELPEVQKSAQEKVKSTRVRVGRNLEGFPLGPAISEDERLEVEKRIKGALDRLSGPLKGRYLSLPSMDEATRRDLESRHLLYKSEDRFLTSAGLMRQWPQGRGLYLSGDNAFSVWVNEEDQLRIIALKQGGDVAEVFSLLARGISELSKALTFSVSPKYGYITSCPTNLGTAMRASVHMGLKALAKNEVKLKETAEKLGLQVRGIHGEHSQAKGGVFDISNRMRLGVTENEAISHLIRGINALADLEDGAVKP